MRQGKEAEIARYSRTILQICRYYCYYEYYISLVIYVSLFIYEYCVSTSTLSIYYPIHL